eukprot:549078_1
MDRSYDKEIGLRELVLQELTDIVDDLLIQKVETPKQIYTEENKYCILLTICLERCITFGMKESGFFAKRDFFEFIAKGSMHVNDEYLAQDFNLINLLLLHKMGKARAWIRKTINECHLARSLYSLASDREFIKSWYEPYAIMSTNAINDLYKEIEKLEDIPFQFNLKDRLLDHDNLFSLPPSQYRGSNKLERLRQDFDTADEDEAENTTTNNEEKKQKKSNKRNRKRSIKRNKSRRNANLNEVNQSTEQSPLKVDFEISKSLSPNPTEEEEENKSKRSKKGRKKKRTQSNDNMAEHRQEGEKNGRKQSVQEWQEKHTEIDTNPHKKHFSDTHANAPHIMSAAVNVHKSEAIRITSRRKGSISERMQNKLAAIPIKINMNRSAAGDEEEEATRQKQQENVFRVHSPSDYHTSFKWNDATKDNSSQIIEKLDEYNAKNRQKFPDPMSYVEPDEDEITMMDDKELEQEITTLIENAPNDDDLELSLSSEEDDLSSSSSTTNNLIEEELEQSHSILSDTKREEILHTNDEYIAAKSSRLFAPETQTFIHHIEHTHENRVLSDVAAQPLSIYFQSDNYFDDENVSRDRRKQEQDRESKKRMQREQDVMRGNDSVYIQKSLNSSGMKGNKPLDYEGNKVVLPSTGIILDETVDKSIDAFFVDQNGECFSCGDHLGSAQISRQCFYTQRLYCALCMDGSLTQMIPSKLMHCLDSRRYPVSASSAKHLESMFDVPAVPLSKIDLPSWYIPSTSANISILKNTSAAAEEVLSDEDDAINIDDEDSLAVHHGQGNVLQNVIPNQNEKYYKLIKLGEYLEIASYIKQYFYDNAECEEINAVVHNAFGRRHYLLDAFQTDKDSFGYFLKIIDQHKEDAEIKEKHRLYGLISMRDISELFNKDLLSTMQFQQKQITNHIKSCPHCKKRSYGANVQFVTKFADVLQ